jgi:hypothetical protein
MSPEERPGSKDKDQGEPVDTRPVIHRRVVGFGIGCATPARVPPEESFRPAAAPPKKAEALAASKSLPVLAKAEEQKRRNTHAIMGIPGAVWKVGFADALDLSPVHGVGGKPLRGFGDERPSAALGLPRARPNVRPFIRE